MFLIWNPIILSRKTENFSIFLYGRCWSMYGYKLYEHNLFHSKVIEVWSLLSKVIGGDQQMIGRKKLRIWTFIWGFPYVCDTTKSWLSYLNNGFRIQNRQVLLLDAPSHVVSSVNDPLSAESNQSPFADFHAFNLSNVTVCFLPPNTTSHIQPLDAGIIKSLYVTKKPQNLN